MPFSLALRRRLSGIPCGLAFPFPLRPLLAKCPSFSSTRAARRRSAVSMCTLLPRPCSWPSLAPHSNSDQPHCARGAPPDPLAGSRAGGWLTIVSTVVACPPRGLAQCVTERCVAVFENVLPLLPPFPFSSFPFSSPCPFPLFVFFPPLPPSPLGLSSSPFSSPARFPSS